MFIDVDSLAGRTAFENRDVLYIAMTRFNVALAGTAGAVAIRASGRMEEWTVNRVELFRRWCLAPMLKQVVRPHAWIVLFDQDVTPPVADLLKDMPGDDWIVPLLCPKRWSQQAADDTLDLLRHRFGHRHPTFICCTRLDSDDSLHTRFHLVADAAVSRLRSSWTTDSAVCLDFPFGAMRHGDALMIRLKVRSFFALVEPFTAFRGPYRFPHTKVDDVFPVVDVLTEQPMYVYQRHDQNISGATTTGSLEEFANPRRVLAHFGLEDTIGAPPPGADRLIDVRTNEPKPRSFAARTRDLLQSSRRAVGPTGDQLE